MDGEELVFTYQDASGEDAQTSFPLSGASVAISSALDVSEQPSESDLLQEELMRFRILYRGNTCYLLAGRKNRKRCLEAVDACAQQNHESVLDMISCVEIE